MIKYIFTILFALITCCTFSQQKAETKDDELTRVLFIFDGSNSMNAQWQSSSKIKIAKSLMRQTLDSLKGFDNVELALRMYGHQYKIYPGQQNCEDTKLEVPFGAGDENIEKIKTRIRSLTPQGTTPIARSLEYSANDFPECSNCRNVIVLITDGIEACDEDPCAVARALRSKGIILKPFVIGIGIDPTKLLSLKCIGKYYDATSEATFKSALKVVVSEALNNTTVQVNLNKESGEPTETDVPMVFYNRKSQVASYNFMHTLDSWRNPDTLSIDPLNQYKLEVYTIPHLTKDSIRLKAGVHNTIELDAGQGELTVNVNGANGKFPGMKILIKNPEDNEIIHVQNMNTSTELLIGEYDLEILTLPRLKFDRVKINQSKRTTIEIRQPGNLNILYPATGYGCIYLLEGDKQEWVCPLQAKELMEQFVLQPGKYKLIYRSDRSRRAAYTVEKNFSISSGHITDLNLLHP
jgi:Ca-activated chloride channel homolog